MSIAELLREHNLTDTVNRYRLQIVHEDNNTYYIEDMKFKTSMVHGRVIRTCRTPKEVDAYLKYLTLHRQPC